jgi:hypothetical protein
MSKCYCSLLILSAVCVLCVSVCLCVVCVCVCVCVCTECMAFLTAEEALADAAVFLAWLRSGKHMQHTHTHTRTHAHTHTHTKTSEVSLITGLRGLKRPLAASNGLPCRFSTSGVGKQEKHVGCGVGAVIGRRQSRRATWLV